VTRERAQVAAVLLLAAAAGTVDAVSFLLLHQTFTANMTGNTTQLGIAAGHADRSALTPLAIAVGTFVVAIALATAAIEVATRRGTRATAAPVLLVEGALLGVFILVRPQAPPEPAGGLFDVLLVVAVAAMGIQTATLVRALGATVRTTYVSGLLTTISQELVNAAMRPAEGTRSYLRDQLGLGPRGRSGARLALHEAVWASFAGGAVWGAWSESRWPSWGVAAPLGAVLLVAMIDVVRPLHDRSRS
jgi:uncharacterized membrane protein YoaK (UPF0700 family)